jgi:hypothetical protein
MATKQFTDIGEAELLERFRIEMEETVGLEVPVSMTVPAHALVGILGIMQLALRHPANNSNYAWEAFADMAHAIEKYCQEFGPATARVCSMGWSRENDPVKK